MLDCWNYRMLDFLTVGMFDCWNNRMLECFTVGMFDCWNNKILDCWTVGMLDCCTDKLLDWWIATVLFHSLFRRHDSSDIIHVHVSLQQTLLQKFKCVLHLISTVTKKLWKNQFGKSTINVNSPKLAYSSFCPGFHCSLFYGSQCIEVCWYLKLFVTSNLSTIFW